MPYNHAQELADAYAEKEALISAAFPSNPNFGQYTDEEWHKAFDEVKAKIYALEASLDALSP